MRGVLFAPRGITLEKGGEDGLQYAALLFAQGGNGGVLGGGGCVIFVFAAFAVFAEENEGDFFFVGGQLEKGRPSG